jgi:hypothetical protein
MNRPLLEEIKLAYQGQNLKPIRRMFCVHENGVDHVCPLVALAVHRGVVDRADPAVEIDGGANAALDWAAGLWGDDFVIGLLDGWDGQDMGKDNPDYVEGYALGVEAAQQLSPSDPQF